MIITINIVWFKRDLRVNDNQVLSDASKIGHVIPLYIIEPDLWKQPDLSYRQYCFLQESLKDLQKSLSLLGQPLIIKVGNVLDVFSEILNTHNVTKVWSHEETWNGWTYERDKGVAKYLKEKGIPWRQIPQNGVIRNIDCRDGWAKKWFITMQKPLCGAPPFLSKTQIIIDDIPTPESLGLQNDGALLRQRGSREKGLDLLDNFLNLRGEYYTKEMSSPVTAYESCSRISPYLAFGLISLREVFQITQLRIDTIKNLPRGQKGKLPSAMRSFSGRLRWHCHFIQKFEDQPSIEFSNMHFMYDGIRENDFNNDYFVAWKNGQTGYPMIDASMRALRKHGWINFRMRAMLVSFASYHLWLHWPKVAIFLASQFTDYEPGIHYSQIQMQSGTTGINSIRIYNPIKQGVDNDPDGEFIYHWIPELANMPKEFIHMPWKNPEYLNGYPLPIVDEKVARKNAADKIYSVRKSMGHMLESNIIVQKHGSRKSPFKSNVAVKKKDNNQGELPL